LGLLSEPPRPSNRLRELFRGQLSNFHEDPLTQQPGLIMSPKFKGYFTKVLSNFEDRRKVSLRVDF
jgi:hypothetical protein